MRRKKPQLISPIYEDIYGPVTEREHQSRKRRERAWLSKAEREMETTLNGLDRQRRPEALARDIELHRIQQAKWAKDNPEKCAAYQRNWKAKQDPELLRQYDRDRYALNKERIKAQSRERYARRKA